MFCLVYLINEIVKRNVSERGVFDDSTCQRYTQANPVYFPLTKHITYVGVMSPKMQRQRPRHDSSIFTPSRERYQGHGRSKRLPLIAKCPNYCKARLRFISLTRCISPPVALSQNQPGALTPLLRLGEPDSGTFRRLSVRVACSNGRAI